jgi:glyoxylase-like metal-dependent hydrolase (beta-lactamase superfamily II)
VKTRKLTPNLIQITRLGLVNAYLVREEDGYTLIDTTFRGAAKRLIAAADAPIRRIALTHGHGDHVGSLDALKRELGSTVRVLMPKLDARIHAGEAATPSGSWPTLATAPDTILRAGDRVGSLQVIPTPGHTPGHVAFLDVRDRALIAGDTFTSVGRLSVAIRPSLPFPLAAQATWDADKTLGSAQALHALEPSLLALGHGRALFDPGAEMERAIDHAFDRLPAGAPARC